MPNSSEPKSVDLTRTPTTEQHPVSESDLHWPLAYAIANPSNANVPDSMGSYILARMRLRRSFPDLVFLVRNEEVRPLEEKCTQKANRTTPYQLKAYKQLGRIVILVVSRDLVERLEKQSAEGENPNDPMALAEEYDATLLKADAETGGVEVLRESRGGKVPSKNFIPDVLRKVREIVENGDIDGCVYDKQGKLIGIGVRRLRELFDQGILSRTAPHPRGEFFQTVQKALSDKGEKGFLLPRGHRSSAAVEQQAQKRYRLVEPFSGPGGWGFPAVKMGAIVPTLACEGNSIQAESYNQNVGQVCHNVDLVDRGSRDTIQFPSDVDVLIGGFPCQGFSRNGRGKGSFGESKHHQVVASLLQLLAPKILILENVRMAPSKDVFLSIRKVADRMGYRMVSGYLDAVDFGAPRHRRRAYFIASRVGTPFLPEPEFAMRGDQFRKPCKTVGQALAGLPSPTIFQATGGRWTVDDPLHMVFKALQPGREGRLERKLDPSKPAPARLFAAPNRLFGDYTHPFEPRSLTLRELARIQGVPDDFVFSGRKTDIANQIGRMVPFALATRILNCVVEILNSEVPRKPRTKPLRPTMV